MKVGYYNEAAKGQKKFREAEFRLDKIHRITTETGIQDSPKVQMIFGQCMDTSVVEGQEHEATWAVGKMRQSEPDRNS